MNKTLLSLVVACIIGTVPGHAQKIEFFAAFNHTDFYDNGEEGHYRSTLVNKPGYTFGVGIDSLFNSPLGLMLQYDRYGGEVTASNGGLGSGYTIEASVRKSIISLLFLPIRIRVSPRVGIGLGVSYSRLVSERYEGIRSDWSGYMPLDTTDLHDAYHEFSETGNFGFLARVVYSISLSESVSLTPHLSWFVGLLNEFSKFPTSVKSMRYHLGIGIKKDFSGR